VRTPVGDRYVVERCFAKATTSAASKSGHVVFRRSKHDRGDGLITALFALALVVSPRRPLSELRHVVERLPQILLNVRVAKSAKSTSSRP